MTEAERELLEAAAAARRSAYAPYSNYAVGAAVRSRLSGRLYRGCNVENASFGLSVCAERSAVFAAVAAGERGRWLEAVAVVTDDGGAPCGACRQVLAEFGPADPPARVLCADSAGRLVLETDLPTLLPEAFGLAR